MVPRNRKERERRAKIIYNLVNGMGGGAYSRRDVLDIMHGRSRMTIVPSHPYNAGTEHVGVSPTRQTLLAPSAKHREVSGESHEG